MTQADCYYVIAHLPNTPLNTLLKIRKFANETNNSRLAELVARHPTIKSLNCFFCSELIIPQSLN